jgi:hypothetical protein
MFKLMSNHPLVFALVGVGPLSGALPSAT